MKRGSIICILAFSFPLIVSAQQKGQLGVNLRISSSTAIGVTYHVTDRFGVRPFVSYNRQTSERAYIFYSVGGEDPTVIKVNPKTEELGGGLGAFFYLSSPSELRIYLGTDFSYSKYINEVPYYGPLQEVWLIRATTEGIHLNSLFGLQYELSKQVRVVGEIGLGLVFKKSKDDYGEKVELSGRQFGLINSGLGFVFYFK